MPKLKTFKLPKKCLLPACDEITEHNGGYCCAEHCREDKIINKIFAERKEILDKLD